MQITSWNDWNLKKALASHFKMCYKFPTKQKKKLWIFNHFIICGSKTMWLQHQHLINLNVLMIRINCYFFNARLTLCLPKLYLSSTQLQFIIVMQISSSHSLLVIACMIASTFFLAPPTSFFFLNSKIC